MMAGMKRFLFITCLLFSLFSLSPVSPILACTPPPGGLPAYTVADHVQAAPVALEGVVSYTSMFNFVGRATVHVVQYLKGNGPGIVEISGFGDGSVCLVNVNTGDHLIFLASGDPTTGQLQAYYLSQFDAILAADEQTLSAAIAAADQDPILIAPLETVLTQAAYTATPSIDETALIATAYAAAGVTPPPPNIEQVFTNAWATNSAAVQNYETAPATQSVLATKSMATIEAAYTQLAFSTPTPAPYPTYYYPPPYYPVTPTPGPTALEVVGLVGVGVVIGLIVGGLGGIVIGLVLGRWHE